MNNDGMTSVAEAGLIGMAMHNKIPTIEQRDAMVAIGWATWDDEAGMGTTPAGIQKCKDLAKAMASLVYTKGGKA